jgi:hypothetical protein
MNCRRRIRGLPRWIRGDYRGPGCVGTGLHRVTNGRVRSVRRSGGLASNVKLAPTPSLAELGPAGRWTRCCRPDCGVLLTRSGVTCCTRGLRPRPRRRAPKPHDELSAFDHSITLSARRALPETFPLQWRRTGARSEPQPVGGRGVDSARASDTPHNEYKNARSWES